MLAIDPAINPMLRPELASILEENRARPAKAKVSVHLMEQNYPLATMDALAELLDGGWILPDTPVFHHILERWFEANQCPGLRDADAYDPDNTKRLQVSDAARGEGEDEPEEGRLVLAAKLGRQAEEAASRQEYSLAIEIYEKVLQLNKRYPLVTKRLRELRRKLADGSGPVSQAPDTTPPLSSLPSGSLRLPPAPALKKMATPALGTLDLASPSAKKLPSDDDHTAVLTLDDVEEGFEDDFEPTSVADSWNTVEESTQMTPVFARADSKEVDTISLGPKRSKVALAEELLLPDEDEIPTAQKEAATHRDRVSPLFSTMMENPTSPFRPAAPSGFTKDTQPHGILEGAKTSEGFNLHDSSRLPTAPSAPPALINKPAESHSWLPPLLSEVEVDDHTVSRKAPKDENTAAEDSLATHPESTPGQPVQVSVFQSPSSLRSARKHYDESTPPPVVDPFARPNFLHSDDSTPTAQLPWRVKVGVGDVNWTAVDELFQGKPNNTMTLAKRKQAFENSEGVVCIFEGPTLVAVGRTLSDGVTQTLVTDVAFIQKYKRSALLFKQVMTTLLHNSEGHQILLVIDPELMPLARQFGFVAYAQTMMYRGTSS